VLLPSDLHARASDAAAALGIDVHARVVVFDVRRNPAALVPAIDWLVSRDYRVIRIGGLSDPMRRAGVVDVGTGASAADLVSRIVMEKARFVVCDTSERQREASLMNTPSLRLNARDPFTAYPVRGNSIFTLAAVVDLDSGRALSSGELLSEHYLRHIRNYGIRPNGSEQVLAAVQEMHDDVTGGWWEDANQTHAREVIADAGLSLASRVPLVAEWGPDEGFLGDGRVARWQAGQLQ
jgi:putative glycosyltransferase (TIGR04372 family)